MLIESTPLFQAMQQKMHWLTDRQEVLSENIANADTPAYQARDLKAFLTQPSSQKNSSFSMTLARTSPAHIAARADFSSNNVPVRDKTYSPIATGNGVVLEEQMKKAADTAIDYSLITNLYKKNNDFLKMAVKAQ